MTTYFSNEPHPHYRVIYPTHPMSHGSCIKGYWVTPPPKGFFTTPKPSEMSTLGYVAVTACFLVFWPLTCLPCFCSTFYDGYQIPVYNEHATLPAS
jgi:hypothetical protein